MNTSPTHTGKIGRLPHALRAELGHRLENARPARQLVRWLNRQPHVRQILKEQFAGRPITEQNLSHWRQTGHLAWLRHEHARHAASELAAHAQDLDQAANGPKLSDCFATILASEMTRLATQLLEPETDPEKRWQRLCHINRELCHLRREDHRAERMALQREQRQRELQQAAEAEEKQRQQERRSKLIQGFLEPFQRRTKIQCLEAMGAGALAEVLIKIIECINQDKPYHHLAPEVYAAIKRNAAADTPTPEPQKSNPIQPNPTPKITDGAVIPHSALRIPHLPQPPGTARFQHNACQTENRRSKSQQPPAAPSVPSAPPQPVTSGNTPHPVTNNPPPVSTVLPVKTPSVTPVLPIIPPSSPLQSPSISSKTPNSPAKTTSQNARTPVSDDKIQPSLTEEEKAYNLWFRRLHYQEPQEWETWPTAVSPP